MLRIVSLLRIFSRRAFSTLSILPRSGSIAWNSRLRPCLALPPAESPSTMYISQSAGLRFEQSESFPGRVRPLMTDLRRTSSLAFFAASRAWRARRALSTIGFSISGRSSRAFLSPS